MASHMKSNLTDMWIKNVKPTTDTQEFGDASSPGLRVRITPKGKKTFVYSYSHPITRTMKRMQIGTYPKTGLKEARSKWSELSDIRLIEKKDPKEVLATEVEAELAAARAKMEEERSAEDVTVTRLIRVYINDIEPTTKAWKEKERVLTKEFGQVYGTASAYSITREDIRKIVSAKRAAGKISQAHKMIAHIRAMYNWAINYSSHYPDKFPRPFSEINPATKIDMPHERKKFRPKPRRREWHPSELRAVVNAEGVQRKDLLMFMLFTGCRLGEAVNMLWSEIQFDEWRQPAEKTKNGEEHVIYLSTQAQEVLKRQRENEPSDTWVWPNPNTNDGHVRVDSASKIVRLFDWGFPDPWTPHDLRRALSSWLGSQMVPREVIERMVNHVDRTVHRTYNQATYNEPAREAWQRWGDYIGGLMDV